MSLVRSFASMEALAAFMERNAELTVEMGPVLIAAAAKELLKRTKKMYGDHSLEDLAQATQEERSAQGYSPNDPLLRDGSLLRDSVEMDVGIDFAAVGTAELINLFHEYGYWNVRANKHVPARPVFKVGLEESAAPIVKLIEEVMGISVGLNALPGGLGLSAEEL